MRLPCRNQLFALIALGLIGVSPAAAESTRVLREPAISANHIAFVYANDIWVVERGKQKARRLTSFPGAERQPHFSPDGKEIAFSGEYDGNMDLYVVPLEGGEPERITWHPGRDTLRGWSPDGSRLIFATGRATAPRSQARLFEISRDGGLATPITPGRAFKGDLSADGKSLAYQMVQPWESEFRNYRGGQAQPIRLMNLQDHSLLKAPWEGSNDLDPVFSGEEIFFISDRNLVANIWSWQVGASEAVQRTFFTEFDCKELQEGEGTLIFENGGWLHTLVASGGETTRLEIEATGDFPWARPHDENMAGQIRRVRISPTGKRALVEARGEVFSIPTEHGDTRALSGGSGWADREPAWSPDGQAVAWFSDSSGEYELVIANQRGEIQERHGLESPSFYYSLSWSPDGEYLAFTNHDRWLQIFELKSGKFRTVDTEGSTHPERLIAPAWSPDSRWLTYSRSLPNQHHAVHLYSLDSGKVHQLTDGMSNAHSPCFDRNGEYLYFAAGIELGLQLGWLDMSSFVLPEKLSLYALPLTKETKSPFAPRSDEEEATNEESDGKAEEVESEDVNLKIDLEGIQSRAVALDLPTGIYRDLRMGKAGEFFYLKFSSDFNLGDGPNSASLRRWSLEDRKSELVADGIGDWDISADGSKLAVHGDHGLSIVDASPDADLDEGSVDLSGLRVRVDPRAEWRQIFREAWRYQRDFFYVRNVHGLDLDWAWEAYSPWLEHLRHRSDLNYLLDILGGETSVGHSFTGGGDMPDIARVDVGLLGVDLEEANGRYRIRRIYDGENWNTNLHAPLAQPGMKVAAGDYLLSVNGVELRAGDNPYEPLERQGGRQVDIQVSSRANGSDIRALMVVPTSSEVALRMHAWVEDNRRRVDELSDGQIAYAWVPDTGTNGYAWFNRYYFAQQDKRGAVIDERFNHGGSIADHIVDVLARDLHGYFNNPVGDRQPWTAPNAALFGPKVMIINEMAGSGGDMLPYMFRRMGIGELVGTKTWGGLVGIWDVPSLIDGGRITAPRGGFYNTEGEWAVENEGVAPDIEVHQDPHALAEGRDPQLEAAVARALERLKTETVDLLPQPKDPVRSLRPDSKLN